MKYALSLILSLALAFSLFSCGEERRADELMQNFISAYGADGVVYTPWIEEGEDGFVADGLTKKIYLYEGKFPENYAIFLNSHTDYSSECGVFICRNAEEQERVIEMCEERIRLLDGGRDSSFIIRSGETVFYSTMSDRARAEKIWKSII